MGEIRTNRWLLSLMYLLAFLLLREWLIPVMELTDTGQIALFSLFIILSFLLSFIGVKWPVSVLVKTFFIFWLVHVIYLEKMLPSLGTIGALVGDITSNFPVIISGKWDSLTNPFRTILFFLLLWMTTYLVRYWIETKRSMFLFYLVTVLFLSFLDTFSTYSADDAILRIMVTGLSLLGLLYVTKLMGTHKAVISPRGFATISIPLLFTIIVSGLFVVMLPKQDPVWPDPIHFIQVAIEGEESTNMSVSKSGYDTDDSKLGGPFIEDETLIFEAHVDKRQYWKIETKDTYTSKGWEQALEGNNEFVYLPGINMETFTLNEHIEVKQSKLAHLEMKEKFPFILYPYGMTKVQVDDDVSFHSFVDNGQYRTMYGEAEYLLDEYKIDYLSHDFSLKALRATTMDMFDSSEGEFDEYLQLPEIFPERVILLAQQITASSHSVYDKAKEIERYFGKNGFKYEREDVAVPGETDDYVDQFLFDSKMGYCDNFSTSMVVMLRAIDIPARWVKGFAPGESLRNAAGERVYQITNNEAHSWVEAYMPGIGWMPFEPTIGFSNPADIAYDIELKADDPEIKEMPEAERPEKDESKEISKKKSNMGLSQIVDKVTSIIQSNIGLLLLVMLIIGGGSLVIYKVRRRWLPSLLVTMNRSELQDWEGYAIMYTKLLKQLDRCELKRGNGETLSNYAKRVDVHYDVDIMKGLTDAYEEGVYGGDKISHDWQRLEGLWKELIKRTSD